MSKKYRITKYLKLNIPDTYQEVEYLSNANQGSSGQMYINTEIVPNSTTEFEIALYQTVANSMFGIRTGSSGSGQSFYNTTSGELQCIRYDSKTQNQIPEATTIGYKYIFHIAPNLRYLEKNGTRVYENTETASYPDTETYPLFLFGCNSSGSAATDQGKGYIYYCKIWNNGSLVRDYIPARRKSDSALGLYDKVSGEFFTSAGSEAFTECGDNVFYVKEALVMNNYTSPNLLNPANIANGRGAKIADGSVGNNSGFSYATLTVEPNTLYTTNFNVGSNGTYGLCFYDSSGTFISGIALSTGYHTFTTPENATLIKITTQESTTSLKYINKGDNEVYEPYGTVQEYRITMTEEA